MADQTAVSPRSQRVQVEPKQEGKGSFSRDQIACLGLERVKTGKAGQKDNNPKAQCLDFSLVNSTNTYRDLLCARHCARGWGFKEALRSTEGHIKSSPCLELRGEELRLGSFPRKQRQN